MSDSSHADRRKRMPLQVRNLDFFYGDFKA